MKTAHVLVALLLGGVLVLPGIVADAAPHHPTALQVQDPEPSGEAEPEREKDEDLPLEGARHFSMSTDRGTWISLDVGPDGEQIVFDLMGDLYLIPFSGGEATRITSGMEFDSQPRFSPDGTEVVYVSDASGGENVWILDLQERDEESGEYEATQVTRGKTSSYISPEWMPDGEYIVVSKSPGPKLWMFHREGGSGFQLIEEPDRLKTVGAAFGDEDRYIWYAQRTGSWQYNAIFPQYQIAYYDRETGETFTRTSRFGSAVRPTLSPDGRWLVYATRFEAETGLRIRDLETGEERWLAYPVQRDDQESTATRDAYPGMSFTPDSSHLVAYWGGRIWKVPAEGGEPVGIPFTARIDVDYGPEVFFEYPVADEPSFTATQIRDGVPSPDGSRLAFTALDQLYVMDWPDGEPRRLTDTADVVEAQPTWSPDGQWIGYVTWSPEDGGNVYKIPAAGGDPVRLTTREGIYQQPTWSPDGDRIVAIRGPARVWEEAVTQGAFGASDDLVWVPAAGGEPTVIAPTEGRGNPHFAGDADRIYLNSRSDGLISIRWDGTDQEGHLEVRGRSRPGSSSSPPASVIHMAPQGGKALAQVGQDLYVVTVPRVGGDTPTVSVANPDRAPVPVRRLTEIGGQFPAWGPDGRTVHWSMGNAHFVYDLDAAEEAERAAEEAEDEEAEDEPGEGEEESDAESDQEGAGGEEEEEDEPVYEPEEVRVLVDAPRDVPVGTAVLRGARVITMVGDEVIEDADVLVRDARIAAVGPRGEVDVPDDARVIDVTGRTIVPGFVDTHAHLRPTFGIHKTQSWSYLANLAYGVTTTRDPQTGSTDVLTYGDKVEAGMMLGPRIYSTGPGIFRGENIQDLDHARDVLRRYSDYYGTNGSSWRPGSRSSCPPPRAGSTSSTTSRWPSTAIRDRSTRCPSSRSTRTSCSSSPSPGCSTRRRCWWPTAAPGPRTGSSPGRTPTTTRSSAASRRTPTWPARPGVAARGPAPGRAAGSWRKSTSTLGWRRWWPTSCTPAARPGWGATASSRDSATTGSCGPCSPAASPSTKRCGWRRCSAPRPSACRTTSAASRPASWRTWWSSSRTRSRTSATPTPSAGS